MAPKHPLTLTQVMKINRLIAGRGYDAAMVRHAYAYALARLNVVGVI